MSCPTPWNSFPLCIWSPVCWDPCLLPQAPHAPSRSCSLSFLPAGSQPFVLLPFPQAGKCGLAPPCLPGLGSNVTSSVRIFLTDPIHTAFLPHPSSYYLLCFLDSIYQSLKSSFFIDSSFPVSFLLHKNNNSKSRDHFCLAHLCFQF